MVSGLDEAYETSSHILIGDVDEYKEHKGRLCIESEQPIEEGGPAIASGLQRSVEVKAISAKRPGSCRGVALETDVKFAVEVVHDQVQKDPQVLSEDDKMAHLSPAEEVDAEMSERDGTVRNGGGSNSARSRDNVVKKMFTMCVIGDGGVQTKYITRKKRRKFLKIEPKSID
ncbi:LOW QUALITY PROTEIN: hypothetical protein PHMEG_00032135 [Phytophthora megakarya]|uniref:Uncharacterized protein n=1 Tax=Phytophthora megakarya TaxID=4795 RepID=A0A225UW87_9STRA|nr:LOW QUALITY PROTEIN: hypothetical protein PHMEG_00032135 [Phytophthora megakarya]